MVKMEKNNISFEGIEEEDIINFKSIRRKDCLKQEEFDKEHNVTTFIGIKLAKDSSGEYVPTSIENRDKFINSEGMQNSALEQINAVNDYLKNNISDISEYNFIDLGAGYGKVILFSLISNAPYKSYTAIEIDPSFLNVLKNNIEQCNKRTSSWPNVNLINQDFRDYVCLPEKTVYYFFRSTDSDIFSEFISKNKELFMNNKTILIDIWPSCGWVDAVEEIFTRVYSKDMIGIYQSKI